VISHNLRPASSIVLLRPNKFKQLCLELIGYFKVFSFLNHHCRVSLTRKQLIWTVFELFGFESGRRKASIIPNEVVTEEILRIVYWELAIRKGLIVKIISNHR
jgi:hypothetical protein